MGLCGLHTILFISGQILNRQAVLQCQRMTHSGVYAQTAPFQHRHSLVGSDQCQQAVNIKVMAMTVSMALLLTTIISITNICVTI